MVDVRPGATQQFVLVTEMDAGGDRDAVLAEARAIAGRRHGLRIDQALILDRGQFPKTPSGKAQRYRCRELALDAGDMSR